MKKELITGISSKKENIIKRIATTIGGFLPMLPFVFFCWMTVFYHWTYVNLNMRGRLVWEYLGVIYIVFISLIRISLIASILVIVGQLITSRGIKGIPFSATFLRIALLVLCVIGTVLSFTEFYLCTSLFWSLYVTLSWPIAVHFFEIPSIIDPRVLFGLLLLFIAVLGCWERFSECKTEITAKIKARLKNFTNIIRKKGNRGEAILKGVSFIYLVIGISFLSWGSISLAVRVSVVLQDSLNPIFFVDSFQGFPWNYVSFSYTIFTILVGGGTLFAGIVGLQCKSRRIVLVAWMIYFMIAFVSIPHRQPSLHELFSSIILLALYLLGWLNHRWQPLVGRWTGRGDSHSEYIFYYDGTGSRATGKGVEGFEWLSKSDGGETVHLTLDEVIESEGQEVWEFNIEEDVLSLDRIDGMKMNDTRVEFVREKLAE